MENLFKIENLNSDYGEERVLENINIEGGEGEILCIIGPNEAGKTTLLKCLTGRKSYDGKIYYEGSEISKDAKPENLARKGIILVKEREFTFENLSVLEGLKMGAYSKEFTEEKLEKVYEVFPKLEKMTKRKAGNLSGGEKRMLALGQAMMAEPELLLLDEPFLGLAPKIREKVTNGIRELLETGGIKGCIVTEQEIHFAKKYSNRDYLLVDGEILKSGKPDEILEGELVQKYLLGQ